VVADALNLKRLRVVPAGGDDFEAEREQWEDGNNVLALEPGVVIVYEWVRSRRPTFGRFPPAATQILKDLDWRFSSPVSG